MPDQRRTGADRRCRHDRRESPGGHLRNALHILSGVYAVGALCPEDRVVLEAVARRVWLALADVQRLQAAQAVPDRGSEPTGC